MEAHLGLLRIVTSATGATTHVNRRTAGLFRGMRDGRLVVPGRSHSQRGILLIVGVCANIAKVSFGGVRIRIDNRVFVEHLPIGLIFGKLFEVGNLVLDLRLNSAESLRNLCLRKAHLVSFVVHEPGLRFVFRHNWFVSPLSTGNNNVGRAAFTLSESWFLELSSLLPASFRRSICSLLSNPLGWFSLFNLCLEGQVTLLVLLLAVLACEARLLAARAGTAGPRGTKVHHNGRRKLITHLVSSFRVNLILLMVFMWHRLRVHTLSAANSSTICNSHIVLTIVAKLKAGTRLILAAMVAGALCMVGWATVGHWGV